MHRFAARLAHAAPYAAIFGAVAAGTMLLDWRIRRMQQPAPIPAAAVVGLDPEVIGAARRIADQLHAAQS